MIHIRRITFFSLMMLLLVESSIQAQSETAQIELIVPAGTSWIDFEVSYLDGEADNEIDFGDGTIESYNGRMQQVLHKYDPAPTSELIVKIDATRLTSLRNTIGKAPGFTGFGIVQAPHLETLRFAQTKALSGSNPTLKDSREHLVDLSKCPNLKEIYLYNVPDLKLPEEHQNLQKLTIMSEIAPSDDGFATLADSHIDLTAYVALTEVTLHYQSNLETIDLTGLTALSKLELKNGQLYRIDGIKELEALTEVDLSGNYLPYSSLPVKRPALTSFEYRQRGVRLAPECVDKNTIHLADQLNVKDSDGIAQPTIIKQVRQLNTPRTLKEGQDYIIQGSDLIILERGFGDILGENPLNDIQLTIKVSNAYYPDYGKTTSDMPELTLDISREGAIYPGGEQPLTFWASEGGSIKAMTTDGLEITSGDNVAPGTPIIFTASPNSGYVITEWQINGITQQTIGVDKKPYTESTLTVDMYSEAMTVSVTFATAEDNYVVTYSKEGEGQLTVTVDGKPLSSGSYLAKGSKILFKAQAFTDNIVQEWQVNDQIIHAGTEQAEYELTVTETTEVKVIFAIGGATETLVEPHYQIFLTEQTLTVTSASDLTLSLYTLSGHLVATTHGETPMEISHLPSGLYLLQIASDWIKITL